MEDQKKLNIADDLTRIVRGDVYDDVIHRAAYATDASIYQILPACVVAPMDVKDVITVVKYAHKNNIPIAARGAGSGVAGESLTTGIVFDTNRHMNRIIRISDDGRTAASQPGVVLDQLNNALTAYNRKIGPDPSTANRATIGGCVANNATGSHSLQYGYIGDYVESIQAVLADGTLVEFKNDFRPNQQNPETLDYIAKQCHLLLTENHDVIEKALPRTNRNRSGYTIAGLCSDDSIDIAKLLAGSEGTLCVFTEITLRTVPVPASKVLVQFKFKSILDAAKAVPLIVDTEASACEMIDKAFLNVAREAYPQYNDILPADAHAVIIVEQIGDNLAEAKQKTRNTIDAVGSLATGHSLITDSEQQQRLEKARKDAVPLLNRIKGGKKPIPFIEDVSVDNKQLPKYIVGLQSIANEYDFQMSLYGHAGDGELHVRPYLDLSDPSDVQKMINVANDVFALAWSLGGSISGEHADGLVRASFVKKQYGDKFYYLLKQIKMIFDPDGIMNPGKIISDDPDVMTRNLRASFEVRPEKIAGELRMDMDELNEELEKCNGCGLCTSHADNLRFCPVYRAIGDELAGPRAKANILRFWTTGQMNEKDFESADFRKFLDLCINCKACALECPSGVDVSKLIGAARSEYVKRKGLRIPEIVLSNNRFLSSSGTTFKPISNFVTNLAITKWVLEKSAGLDKRRSLPKFESGSFIKAAQKYLKSCPPIEEPIDKVAYFVDTYANSNDHELGFAVLDVLVRNGIDVIVPKQKPAPLPAVCYGDAKRATADLSYSVRHLADAVRKGYKIICSEPSAVVCLQDEIKNFVWNDDAKLVSGNTDELMIYLLDLYKHGKLQKPKECEAKTYLYHLPCHLCAVGNGRATIELFAKICNSKVMELQAGCCGIAGTFGMQKKNYELSARIASTLKRTLEKSDVECVLTECSACKMQIEHISDKTVLHPIKILARAYSDVETE